jgi:ribosomal protein S18 acetylase RimI-like enzyme
VSAPSATSIDGSSATRIDAICQEGSDQGTVRIMLAAVLQLEALHHRKQDHRKLAVQPELFLVGTLDSVIVASGMAGYDGHRGYLYYLAVAPEHQRKGYGRALVAHLQDILHERGCPKLNLFVSTDGGANFFL